MVKPPHEPGCHLSSEGELSPDGIRRNTQQAIAAPAQVDLASINHHFGNCSGLYQTVLAEASQGTGSCQP